MAKFKGDRVGESNYNNQGELMTIISYNNSLDIIVEFKDTKSTKKCAYREFKNGSVCDNFYPSVYGIGYIGNTTITIGNRIVKRSYRRWADMLCRCYSEKHRNHNIAYAECSVCDEWLCYANFEKWHDKNYYEIDGIKIQLDKDILVKGNKVYSPNTCIFVPQKINSLLTTRRRSRGKYPIGVTRDKRYGKFYPQVQGVDWLGSYDTPEEAFEVYKTNKEIRIKQVADEYRNKIPDKLYNALYNYKVEITD